jgi:hypothetical protein
LGTTGEISPDFEGSELAQVIDHVEYGNAYRYILENVSWEKNLLNPNYEILEKISLSEIPIINQLAKP